jgi:hypothetical protein
VAFVNIKHTLNKLVFFALFKLLLRACQTEIVRSTLLGLLQDGRVLIAGGTDAQGDVLATAEIYK